MKKLWEGLKVVMWKGPGLVILLWAIIVALFVVLANWIATMIKIFFVSKPFTG